MVIIMTEVKEPEKINRDCSLVKKALCFHGKPMKKTWDEECGIDDLQKIGIAENEDYAVYMERQKYFTFQDRSKRLKLHQFLARKSMDLYDTMLLKPGPIQNGPETILDNEKCKLSLGMSIVNRFYSC